MTGNARYGNYYAGLDIWSAFDFLPTHEDSQKKIVLVTRRNAWMLIGALMDGRNTPAMFTHRIVDEIVNADLVKLFARKLSGALLWSDDILLYSDIIDNFLNVLDRLLKQIIHQRRRLNLTKCSLFQATTEWCGREFKGENGSRVRVRERVGTVIYLCNFLSTGVPRLAELREAFNNMIQLKRKKFKDQRRIDWTQELIESYWKQLKMLVFAIYIIMIQTYLY